MPIREVLTTGGQPVRVWTDDIDPAARLQLGAVARLPIVAGPVAAMPDVHVGIGATIGSVIPTAGALIPAAVGVDIGCGMTAGRLSIKADALPDDLRPVRAAIEDRVPVGRAGHARTAATAVTDELAPALRRIIDKHPGIGKMLRAWDEKWRLQLGSLGSGNHFIELSVDENDGVWFMLHSGSRGIGNAIGRYFTRLARADMERLDRTLPEDRDLCYLEEGNQHLDDYVEALGWAQRYALENRRAMTRLVVEALNATIPPFRIVDKVVDCHHNYVAGEEHFGRNVWVTRKGAIRAREGDRGIIPGSMGTQSYIVSGRGATDALCSAPHGAGRRLSRKEAKRRYSPEDLAEQTRGVECRKDEGVVDESPAAYKPIEEVIGHAGDLVRIEHTLKQVVCVKG